MRRREFIAAVAGSCAWPYAGRAQDSIKRPLIAFFSASTPERGSGPIGSFVRGLRELDYVEGRDCDIAYRYAAGHLDQLPAITEELLHLQPNLIVVTVTPAAVAARALTQTVPIVCPLLADPIRLGLIANMSRPGGNVTGLMFRIDGLTGKQLELARQLIPDLVTIGLVVNVASGIILDRQEAENEVQRLGMKLISAEVRIPDDLPAAFHTLANAHVQAVIMLVDGMFFNERERIASLAAATRLPTVYAFRDHVDAGGLISYGANLSANFHRAASYVVKILKGAEPGDLPVEFPTKLELVINLKAAGALDLIVPPTLLARADEVIE